MSEYIFSDRENFQKLTELVRGKRVKAVYEQEGDQNDARDLWEDYITFRFTDGTLLQFKYSDHTDWRIRRVKA